MGEMGSCRIFQISGIKTHENKKYLVKGIQQLGGKYIGGSVYKQVITHLIVPKVLHSEKFLAACAAGKWVVTLDYVLDSVKNGSWLPEKSYEVAIPAGSSTATYPTRYWREKVLTGRMAGAFQGWSVLLIVKEPMRRAVFKRLLKAGKASVYSCPPTPNISITHVIAKPMMGNSNSYNAPNYPVSHIAHHLFKQSHLDVNLNVMKGSCLGDDPSELETELKGYVMKKEGRPRMCFLDFLGCHDPHVHSQPTATDFSNVGSMIECGLFAEALDSIRSAVYPGVLPPATYLISLFHYAQQGNATSDFIRSLCEFLNILILTNPPWQTSNVLRRYYIQVLQCPECKTGLWPFLETAIRYCLSSGSTCHSLPGPALPTLVNFSFDIVALCLKIFQGELHSITSRDFMKPQAAQASSFLMYPTFWTVWERSTLLSRAVKQLTQLLIEAAVVDYGKDDDNKNFCLADTLLELFSVLVEFWHHHHFKQNQVLVDMGFKDLSEHIALKCQDVSPAVWTEMVSRLPSTRFKLVMADAIFRNVCCRDGITLGDESLSLKKMVLSYLPALESLAQSPGGKLLGAGHNLHICMGGENSCRCRESSGRDSSAVKENIPKGLHRVNAAGETLLHRACKKNQVETVLQILELAETDINVRDHAGWTPLHEACNHGSTECVKVLLQHRPAPVLNNQVEGVSPLHDALLNGHIDIAKLLLQHGGTSLLHQTDRDGRLPLDLLSVPAQREELSQIAQIRDASLKNRVFKVSNLPLLEAGSCLLGHLIVSYLLEWGLPSPTLLVDKPSSLGYTVVKALETHSLQEVTLGWTDQRAVRLVEDMDTLLELNRRNQKDLVAPAVRECKGENTQFLMQVLDNLRSRGEVLLGDL